MQLQHERFLPIWEDRYRRCYELEFNHFKCFLTIRCLHERFSRRKYAELEGIYSMCAKGERNREIRIVNSFAKGNIYFEHCLQFEYWHDSIPGDLRRINVLTVSGCTSDQRFQIIRVFCFCAV